MVKIYRTIPLSDDYQSVWYRPEDRDLFIRFGSGKPFGNRWPTPRLVYDGECLKRANREIIPDFPPLTGDLIIASAHALSVIWPLVEGKVEALPVKHPSEGEFFALNVVRVIDCLDVSHCETNASPDDPTGFFTVVYKYAFYEEMLVGEHIFKVPQLTGLDIYVSQEFRRRVKAAKLLGLGFVRVYP